MFNGPDVQSDRCHRGEAKVHILDFKTTYQEFQMPRQTTALSHPDISNYKEKCFEWIKFNIFKPATFYSYYTKNFISNWNPITVSILILMWQVCRIHQPWQIPFRLKAFECFFSNVCKCYHNFASEKRIEYERRYHHVLLAITAAGKRAE